MAFGMLTTADAARIAEVGTCTVRAWIADGKVPAIRCGGQWLIEPSDLATHLARPRPQRPTLPSPGRTGSTVVGPQMAAQALIQLEGEPATPDELAVLIGRHPGNVRKYLLLLAAVGHAERRDGSWTLTAAGDAAYRTEVAA